MIQVSRLGCWRTRALCGRWVYTSRLFLLADSALSRRAKTQDDKVRFISLARTSRISRSCPRIARTKAVVGVCKESLAMEAQWTLVETLVCQILSKLLDAE
jgi:hypothetical protein